MFVARKGRGIRPPSGGADAGVDPRYKHCPPDGELMPRSIATIKMALLTEGGCGGRSLL